MQVLVNLDLNKNELQNAVMQPLTVAPSSPREGQFYYSSTDKKMRQWNGTTWFIYGDSINWADVTNKPAGLVVDANYVHTDANFTVAEKSKLGGVAVGAEVNVNTDWNATSGDAQLLNKPSLAPVATSGSFNDLTNKPTPVTKTSQLTNDSDFATNAGTAVKIADHNTSGAAHSDIRTLITNETTSRATADTTLQGNIDATNSKIDNLKSVQILNKAVINSTIAAVQTTCTNYISTEYSRQPKNLDGLIITLTDSVPANDKVQFVYSSFSTSWVDTGTAQTQISEGSKAVKGIVQVGDNIDVAGGIISIPKGTSGKAGVVQGSSTVIITDGVASTSKAAIGLGNVDNTSDANKPVSTAQKAALDLKANLNQLPPTIRKQTGTVPTTAKTATVTVGGYIVCVDIFDSVTKEKVLCDVSYTGGTIDARTTAVVTTATNPVNILNIVVTYIAS